LFEQQGLTDGLDYPQVSAYIALAPGAYDLRFVKADATDCSTPLAPVPPPPDVVNFLPSFDAGSYWTLVYGPSLAGKFFSFGPHMDDPIAAPEHAKLRFINEIMPRVVLDMGIGTGESFVPFFTGVDFEETGSGDGVGPNGFLETEPICAQPLVVRVTNDTTDRLVVPDFSLSANSITTIFSIGESFISDDHLLVCHDEDKSQAFLSNCSVVLTRE